jgi:phosphohistidine phosphatase
LHPGASGAKQEAMKTLTLLRHAKAVEAVPGRNDHERPLRERGLRAARWVGETTTGQIPDLVLCSTSLRTRETWAALSQAWSAAPPVLYERGLYLASPHQLLQRLESLEPTVGSAWLIGHNPGIHELARHLAGAAEGNRRFPALAAHFPTSARAVFSIEAEDWADLAAAQITLQDFALAPSD